MTKPSSALTLAELLEFEFQLQKDSEQEDSQKLRKRDQALAKSWQGPKSWPLQQKDKLALIRHWLRGLRDKGRQPGQRFYQQLLLAGKILSLAGLLLGYSSMSVILHYDGQIPVNVFGFLLFFVGFQLILVIPSAYGLLRIAKHSPHDSGQSDRLLMILTAKLIEKLSKLRVRFEGKKEGDPLADTGAVIQLFSQHLPGLRNLYLFQKLQYFAVSFQLGALLCLFYLVAFSDMAFAWQTTLITVDNMKQLVDSLALPWAAFRPDWVPSWETLRDTQYYRLDNRYLSAEDLARAKDPEALGAWWPFLFMCLFTYGLLPRLLVLVINARLIVSKKRHIDLGAMRHHNFFRRLLEPQIHWQAEGDPESSTAISSQSRANRDASSALSTCYLIIWRDIPTDQELIRDFLQDCYHIKIANALELDGDLEGIESLDPSSCLDSEGILILVEDFEFLDDAMKDLIGALRARLGPQLMIQILLVSCEADKVKSGSRESFRSWESQLTKSFNDPYLGLAKGEKL